MTPTKAVLMKRQCELGENKAISLVTYEKVGDKITLGVMVMLPTRYDSKENKTYYKAVGIEAPITEEQRRQLRYLFAEGEN